MLIWHNVNDNPIPDYINGNCLYLLAVHKSAKYTSDVYMVWRNENNEIVRWPHEHIDITHWAYFSFPTEN